MTELLSVKCVTCGYRGKPIVCDIDLTLAAGEILCLLGPNGAGKTTLFKTMLGLLSLQAGQIEVAGKPLARYSLKELARRVAYVPQIQAQAFPFSVLDVVAMGRCSRLGAFASPGSKDFAKAEECLDRLGAVRLASSAYTEISGGERQMVLIARALAQEPDILVMDEPTSNLDFGNQTRLLNVARRLASSGIGILMTTHFPDHAFLAGDRVAVMKNGRLLATGTPEEIIVASLMRDVYGVAVKIIESDDGAGNAIKTCVPILEE